MGGAESPASVPPPPAPSGRCRASRRRPPDATRTCPGSPGHLASRRLCPLLESQKTSRGRGGRGKPQAAGVAPETHAAQRPRGHPPPWGVGRET